MTGLRPSSSLKWMLLALGLAVGTTAVAIPAGAESGDALASRIQAELATRPELVDTGIRVVVRDGRVVLQGWVPRLQQREAAEQSLSTLGVSDVGNELQVVSFGCPGDVVIKDRVRALLKLDGRFVDTSLQLSVSGGIVELRGLFEDPEDIPALKQRIAAIPGVLYIRIEPLLVS